jgi:hypothetical protein
MSTFLLTWNPKAWKWDDFDECVAELVSEGTFQSRWSTGVTKRMVEGDRCFLMRLGAEHKGIIASGFFCSGTFWDDHWSGEEGRSCLYANVEFDVLVSPFSDQILPLEILKSKFPSFNWTPQASVNQSPKPFHPNSKSSGVANFRQKNHKGRLGGRNVARYE